MRKSTISLAILTLAALLTSTSCSLFETNPTTVAFQTTEMTVTVTTGETSDAGAPEKPMESSEASMPEENSVEYLIDLTASSVSLQSVYLLSPQEVTVVDDSIIDGITESATGPKTRIPGGMVAIPMDTDGNIVSEIDPKTLFVLLDGRCVRFDVATANDGALLLNGLYVDKILGRRVADELYRKMDVQPEGELLAMAEPDPDVSYKILTLRTDWNADGKEDTFRRELDHEYDESNGTLIFTDGATGESTDVTDCLMGPNDEYHDILSEGAFLYDDQNGNRMIIDSFDVYSSDYVTFVYMYDPEKIIVMQKFEGVFDVEDGEMFLERNSTIFGNSEKMIYPVTIADAQFMVTERSTELYWQESWNMDPDSEYPNFYSCTLQEITAERMTGDAIDTITIPAGMAIFPLYTVVDENGAGILYFRTVDDSNCQISYALEDNGWNPLFGGLEQRDLFWCAFGG